MIAVKIVFPQRDRQVFRNAAGYYGIIFINSAEYRQGILKCQCLWYNKMNRDHCRGQGEGRRKNLAYTVVREAFETVYNPTIGGTIRMLDYF